MQLRLQSSVQILACVASISVGFQSRERPKNEILITLPHKKWERVKKWSEGGGGRNHGTKNGDFFALISPVAKLSKSCSSVFLCSENPQKRLLRRLCKYQRSDRVWNKHDWSKIMENSFLCSAVYFLSDGKESSTKLRGYLVTEKQIKAHAFVWHLPRKLTKSFVFN